MNPAARLLTIYIYDVLIRQQKDQTLNLIWAAVFELDTTNPHLEDYVTSCVVALRQEIDFTRMRLNEHSVPSSLSDLSARAGGISVCEAVWWPGILFLAGFW